MMGMSSLVSRTSGPVYNTRPEPYKYVNRVACIRWSCNVQPRLRKLYIQTTPLLRTTPLLTREFHSLSAGTRGVVSTSSFSGSGVGDTSGVHGNDLPHKVKEDWQSPQTGEKAKEDLDEVTPYVEQLLNTHPFLRDRIIPVGGITMGTIAASYFLAWIFRNFHSYSVQVRLTLLSFPVFEEVESYEGSVSGALEVSLRCLVIFMAFLQIGAMVAPRMIASHYIIPGWRIAVVLSFAWCLLQWINHMESLNPNKHQTLVIILSIGVIVLSGMTLALACGVPVKYVLTFATGIGGAVIGNYIINNVHTGFALQYSRPFSVGDFIKVGSAEGRVMEMGLTTITLCNAKEEKIVVPNSSFSSKDIVNKSRGEWRPMVFVSFAVIDDPNKIPQMREEIKEMIKSCCSAVMGEEGPFCYVISSKEMKSPYPAVLGEEGPNRYLFPLPSEGSLMQITAGCDLRQMPPQFLRAVAVDAQKKSQLPVTSAPQRRAVRENRIDRLFALVVDNREA